MHNYYNYALYFTFIMKKFNEELNPILRCYSYVGQAYITGGQTVSIGAGCEYVGTVLHEILHTLGFFHTSSRHDRDSYVVIDTSNIISGAWVWDNETGVIRSSPIFLYVTTRLPKSTNRNVV